MNRAINNICLMKGIQKPIKEETKLLQGINCYKEYSQKLTCFGKNIFDFEHQPPLKCGWTWKTCKRTLFLRNMKIP
jgi:hypothetical protein